MTNLQKVLALDKTKNPYTRLFGSKAQPKLEDAAAIDYRQNLIKRAEEDRSKTPANNTITGVGVKGSATGQHRKNNSTYKNEAAAMNRVKANM